MRASLVEKNPVKNLLANEVNTRDCEFNLWVRRRKWQPAPVFLPENSMDRGAWWATVHRVPKSQPQLSMHAHTHNH